jgi:hypothetical protein
MKYLRYSKYLVRHKWFVFIAGLDTGAPIWRLVIHDWSKFLPCEFGPYTEFFYGSPTDGHTHSEGFSCEWHDLRRDSFDKAWLHHQHANAHHWQHWMLREDSGATKLLEMPDHFAREMAADWMGAGRAITGKWEAASWYAKNRNIIQLAPNTRIKIDRLMNYRSPNES